MPVGVGVVGAGWMGHVHTRAYQRVPHHHPELPARARLVAVADPVAERCDDAVARYGFERTYRDWRDLVADPDVTAVSVTAPNALHRELGEAVANAGKHLWIEKPVGLGLADARAVAAAVEKAGVVDSVGFNYRNAPAVARARELLAEGAIGSVTHARFQLLTDYAAHPRDPFNWRFERGSGGSGVLGDLASHGVDLVRYLLGDLASVCAQTAVFIPTRPVRTDASYLQRGGVLSEAEAREAPAATVENEDYLVSLVRTRGGALVTLEASRVSVGDQNAYGFEIHGTRGQLRWDFRRMGELAVSAGDRYDNQPVTLHLTGPGDGDHAAFQPGAGIALGYDDLKVMEARAFLAAIARAAGAGSDAGSDVVGSAVPDRPTVADAVAGAAALEAMVRSAADGGWVAVESG